MRRYTGTSSSLRCDFDGCDARFNNRQAKWRHVKRTHEGTRFVCEFQGCNLSFSYRDNMKRHFKIKHASEALKWVCKACDAKFASSSALDAHTRSLPAQHSRKDRAPLSISSDDVTSSNVFCGAMAVAEQAIFHNTSPNARQEIDRDLFIRPSKDVSIFDGVGSSELPGFAFFGISPASHGAILPFSSFPRSLSPGSPTAMVKLDLSFLSKGVSSGEWKLFHVQTLPSQSQLWVQRKYHTFVVAAEKEHWETCRKLYVELDPAQNSLFHLKTASDGKELWEVATQLKEADGGEMRSLSVTIAFCGGLSLSHVSRTWVDSWRLKAVSAPDSGFTSFHCPLCDKAIPGGLLLFRNHYFSQHTDVRIPCDEPSCRATFSTYDVMRTHHESAHGGARVSCEMKGCAATFTNEANMRRHFKSQHRGVTYECDHEGCDLTFSSRTAMRTHFTSKHEKVRRVCDVPGCGRTFSCQAALRTHIRTKHEGSTKRLSCTFPGCSRSYANSTGLRTHIKSAHEGIRFPCEDASCSKEFSSRGKMIRHYRAKHNSD